MLRRQYKYLISPNGSRHSTLIAPHIIWGAISAADIPFDPPFVSPVSSSLYPISGSLSFVYAVYFGLNVIIWPPPSIFLPFLVGSFTCCHYLSLNAHWRLSLTRISSLLYLCVSPMLCCVCHCFSPWSNWGYIAARATYAHTGNQRTMHSREYALLFWSLSSAIHDRAPLHVMQT